MAEATAKVHLGLTDAGKIVLHGIGFVAFAALVVPAFGVLSILVTIFLIALLVGFVLRPRIRMSGDLPDRVLAGQTVRATYLLRNVGRLPSYNLWATFGILPEAIEQVGGGHFVPRLGPGETAKVHVVLRAKRRGHHKIKPPICRSSFPFNLFSFGVSAGDEDSLIVLPAFSLVEVPLRRLSRPTISSRAAIIGHADVFPEYAGNRPFVPGDSPRKIDARAWARLSVPATKEYDDDFDSYAALILDTTVPETARRSSSDEIEELEAAVSLCASAAFMISDDSLIELLLTGPEVHQFTGWTRISRRERIHEILAGIGPSEGNCLEAAAPMLIERFYKLSMVVFIALSWNESYTQLLELARQAGCHCTVLVVGQAGKMSLWRAGENWPENIQFLSADEILWGR
jgi:uncharacterized protein (DUF58 family)